VRKCGMIFKIIISLLVFFLILSVLVAFYTALIYPIVQLFKRKNEFGYVISGLGGYEHRAKVQKMIGRNLGPNEEVHHINGKKWDNKRSNLALMTRSNHQGWHGRLEWMYGKKMFPSIKWQRKKLIEEFEARLF
jgi:hypothetical protein